jgi:hypothetical protein
VLALVVLHDLITSLSPGSPTFSNENIAVSEQVKPTRLL